MSKPIKYHSPVRLFGTALFAFITVISALDAADDTEPKIQTAEPMATPVAIGAELGTTGYGPVVVLSASKYFTANLGYTFFSYNYDFSDSDGDYNGKLKFSNVQALFNYHPFAGTFHISAGAFISNNKVDATGKPSTTATFTIGGTSYSAAQVGTLNGNVNLTKGAVPYVGLGWSKNPIKKGFGCFFDLGVLLMGSPKTTLSGTGDIATNPSNPGYATFQTNLAKEQAKLNTKLDGFKYYPVAQFGLIYRF